MEESYINTNEGNNSILKFELNYFYKLDSENNICFDCGGALPCFVSINNGVFICKFCAENHKKNLNYNISYIYDLNSEFDNYLLSFITRGGNSRFKRLCLQYEVPCMSISQNNQEKINKYIIRLGEYHRLLLKSEINCSEPPPPLYREVAHNLIDVNTIYFPEFENYTLFRGNNTTSSNKNNNSNNPDESMTSKIWEGTKTTFNVMKTTSGIIYNTSKPIVSFLGNAAFTGLKFIGNSVWNYYTKKNENDGNNNNDNEVNNNITAGNNIPMNYNNDMNYINNLNNNGNNQFDNYNGNRNMNNNMNNNLSYISNIGNNNNNNNYNYYQKNKNYLTNSNKFTIFTINEEKSNNINNMQNMQNNYYSKPNSNTNNINNINNKNKENQIPNFYDENCINNESINNITTYINNNNSLNNISKSKIQLLNHNNIIINDKYINDKNFLYNNNYNNNIPESSKNRLNINNQDLKDNNYPNFSLYEKSMNNDNIILDKNVPNIIGEERYQEKARYPLYQSTNLLNENTFTPCEFDDNN